MAGRPDDTTSYDPTAREVRAAARAKIKHYRRYNRAARQVACQVVGLTLQTTSPLLADDFGDGSGDYIAPPVPAKLQAAGRMTIEQAIEQTKADLTPTTETPGTNKRSPLRAKDLKQASRDSEPSLEQDDRRRPTKTRRGNYREDAE